MTGAAPAAARTLPDEYAGLSVASGNRVLELVARRWGDRSEGDRRQLAQILILLLEPLNEPGVAVTEELRSACEQVVAQWVEKTTPASGPDSPSTFPPAPEKSRRVRLVEAQGNPQANGEWVAQVTLQVGARRFAGTDRGPSDPLSQLHASAKATLAALRQAVPGAPHIELKKVETFEAFDSLGVIVALRVTEGIEQTTLVGVCPSAGLESVRGAAVAVLNATNRRLGTG